MKETRKVEFLMRQTFNEHVTWHSSFVDGHLTYSCAENGE